jgi:hypothetical protein
MGYRGGNNFDERDKLFGSPSGDRNKAKQNLDSLFAPKAADKCADGHQWIRDFDRVTKCARCRIPKPAE